MAITIATATATAVTAETATTDVERVEFPAGRLEREAARMRAAELFDAHRELIARICRGLLRDEPEAEDAAQQTFLSAYRALLAGSVPRDEEAWLATIARNECLQRIKSRMRQPLPVLRLEPEDVRGDVHQQALERVRSDRLWREIAHLPPQQRQAVVLRELAGLSYEQVAAALGISVAAVESLLFRARFRLRARLQAAFAAIDLGSLASGAAAAFARFLGSSGAPLAVKAAAVGAGVAVVGGGGYVSEQELMPHARGPVVAAAPAAPVRFVHSTTTVRVETRSTSRLAARAEAAPVALPRPTAPLPRREGSVHEDGVRTAVPSFDHRGRDRGDGSGDEHGPPVAVAVAVTPVTTARPTTPTTTARAEEDGDSRHGETTTLPSVPTAPATTVATTTTSRGDGDRRGETTITSQTTTAATTTTVTTTSSSRDGGGGVDGDHGGSTTPTTTAATTTTTTTDGGLSHDGGGEGKG